MAYIHKISMGNRWGTADIVTSQRVQEPTVPPWSDCPRSRRFRVWRFDPLHILAVPGQFFEKKAKL